MRSTWCYIIPKNLESVIDRYNLDPIIIDKSYVDRQCIQLFKILNDHASIIGCYEFIIENSKCHNQLVRSFFKLAFESLSNLKEIAEYIYKKYRTVGIYDDYIPIPSTIRLLVESLLTNIIRILRESRHLNRPSKLIDESLRVCMDTAFDSDNYVNDLLNSLPKTVSCKLLSHLKSNQQYLSLCADDDITQILHILTFDDYSILCDKTRTLLYTRVYHRRHY